MFYITASGWQYGPNMINTLYSYIGSDQLFAVRGKRCCVAFDLVLLAFYRAMSSSMTTYPAVLPSNSRLSLAVNRDPNAPAGYIPLSVSVDIDYQQVDTVTKRLVAVSVNLDDFAPPPETGPIAYNLTVNLVPLDYFGLINAFAFNEAVYAVLYLGIGVINLLIAVSTFPVRLFGAITLLGYHCYEIHCSSALCVFQ